MVHRSTDDVVQRVMPLIDQFAQRTLEKTRLLKYLSVRAGIDWGTLILEETIDEGILEFGGVARNLVVRDRLSGDVIRIRRPECLPDHLEESVVTEYKRLALRNSLASMNSELFAHLFQASHCDRCEWRGVLFEQFHRECRYVGRPVNYKLRTSGSDSCSEIEN